MAIDYSGLLTGISKDPKAEAAEMLAQSAIAQNPNLYAGTQYAMGQAPRREAAMRQAVGGMLGKDLRSPAERARQELQQMSMSPNFNPSEPEQQKKLLELARVVNPVEAVKVASQIEQQNALRNSLLKIARAQGNTEIEEFLKAGGDPAKAAEVLFRKQSNTSKSIVMTESKANEFLDRWGQLTDAQKLASGAAVPGKFYGINEDSTLLNQLFAKAEYIYHNNPTEGGRAAALDQAVMEASGAAPVTPTIGGVAALPDGGPAAVAAAANAAASAPKDPHADTVNLVIGE
jgi:hypothetical protein